jgi:PAS domain S-box-containing protein
LREGQQSAQQAETEQRLHFEMLLADICAQFVNLAPSEVDSRIESAQRAICQSLRVDHSSVWQASEENPEQLVMTHTYRDPNSKPLPPRPILKEYFPWSQSKILKKQIVCVPNTAKLPPEAAKDMESWRQYGIRSALAFPLSVGGGQVLGFVAFDSTGERDWPELLQRRLQILAHVIAQALDRKNAERKVCESENRFRLVADTAPVLIWMSGTDKLCTYFNKPWLDFTGRSLAQELGNGWAEGIHPDDLQRCLNTYRESFGRREKFRMEYRLRRHDGEYRWIFDIGVPRFNQDHSFAGYIGSCIDVTERKLAEDARFRHAAVVESSEDAIISKNLDAVVTSWNAGAERMFGYTEAEVVGQPISILIPHELLDEENNNLERLRAGGRIEHYETVRITKAGKKVAVSLSISPIKDSTGRTVGFSKIAHDITERKRAEQALHKMNRFLEGQTSELQAQEELLKIFVKHVPAGVAMLDRDMRYLQVSDRWCADYSVDSSQVLGRSHYELFPDIPDRWKEMHRRGLAGETLRTDEDRWDRECGTTWVRWEIRPWWSRDGLPGGILIFAEDITHRKQMEAALSGMTRKLIEAQEQERARIARELHDDITQRLAMLALEIEQAPEYRAEIPAEERDRAHELSKRTKEIASDIQSLSHELHSSALEYLGLEAGMRSWCKEFSERHKLQINFQSHDVPQPPHEISLCLFRVLQEALQNAAKHSGANRIEVQLARNSGEIHLIVSDSGEGFDIKAPGRSRGLGLTSMQERVRLVGGTIVIDSEPEAGTTIQVRVPIEAQGYQYQVAPS